MVLMLPMDESPRSPLMREVMKVHAIDLAKAPEGLLRLAVARCRRCEDADACCAWLAGARPASAYRWFCPNARLFDGLPKSAAY